jgi:hypothetical protein
MSEAFSVVGEPPVTATPRPFYTAAWEKVAQIVHTLWLGLIAIIYLAGSSLARWVWDQQLPTAGEIPGPNHTPSVMKETTESSEVLGLQKFAEIFMVLGEWAFGVDSTNSTFQVDFNNPLNSQFLGPIIGKYRAGADPECPQLVLRFQLTPQMTQHLIETKIPEDLQSQIEANQSASIEIWVNPPVYDPNMPLSLWMHPFLGSSSLKTGEVSDNQPIEIAFFQKEETGASVEAREEDSGLILAPDNENAPINQFGRVVYDQHNDGQGGMAAMISPMCLFNLNSTSPFTSFTMAAKFNTWLQGTSYPSTVSHQIIIQDKDLVQAVTKALDTQTVGEVVRNLTQIKGFRNEATALYYVLTGELYR